MIKKNYLKILLLTLIMALVATGCSSPEDEDTKEPTDQVEDVDNKDTDDSEDQEEVSLLVYTGSGQLLAQMETSGKGDVFIVGSEDTYNMVKDKGQAGESVLIAHHTPGLAVEKGNPKNIKSLKDLTAKRVFDKEEINKLESEDELYEYI